MSHYQRMNIAIRPAAPTSWLVFLLVILSAGFRLLSSSVSTDASAIVIPPHLTNSPTAYGSGTLTSVLRVQQIYGANNFATGAISIVELRFRPDNLYGTPFVTTVSNIQISISTSVRRPDQLSNNFEENIGADEVIVFKGLLGINSQFTGPTGGPKDFDIVIPLNQAFVYYPISGNLLLDIRNYSGSKSSLLSGTGVSFDSCSRISGTVNGTSGSADTGIDALQILYYPTNPPINPPSQIIRGPYLQTQTQSSIEIRWRTNVPTDSRVSYGPTPETLNLTELDPIPVVDHRIRLSNLTPNTLYYYAVGKADELLAGDSRHYFKTAPNEPRPIRIWAIGDSGTAAFGDFGSHLVRDAYLAYEGSQDTDVWLMLGDNAYDSGTDAQYQVAVFDTYPSLLRHIPVWSTIGNHETYSSDINGHFAYLDIFSPPQNGEAGGIPSGNSRYYSFEHANIHFVCLDSETSSSEAHSPMIEWLRMDLEANSKDWLIAFWHTPPYSKGSHDSDFEAALTRTRTNLLPLLESHGVDLVLCGHSHNYERSFLLNGHYGASETLEPTMILDSGSGRPNETGAYFKNSLGPAPNQGAIYVVAGSSGWATFATGHHPVMYAQLLERGSLIIDIDSNRLDSKFLRETGAIEDEFTIIKANGPDPLRITSIYKIGSKTIVRWKSVVAHTYQVLSKPGLNSTGWAPASPPITATEAVTSWTNNITSETDQTYYQILELGED